MKHREDQLRDVRARLLARGAELSDRIRRVQADLGRTREPLPRDSSDAAMVMENDEVLRALESTAEQEIRHVHHALERIDAGTFGACEKCGGRIADLRLEAVPYATTCARCEQAT